MTPNSPLNNVLLESLAHFKLSQEENAWILEHQGKELPLTVPLRLLNLAKGAKLELKAVQKGIMESTKGFRVKFQVLGHGVEVLAVKANDSVMGAIQSVCSKNKWELTVSEIKLQCFSQIWKYEEVAKATFAELGILDNVSVRLTVNSGSVQKAEPVEKVTPTQMAENLNAKVAATDSNNSKSNLHEISTYIPSDTVKTIDQTQTNDEDYEISITQFQRYQKMIAKKAGNGGALLTKRMRDEEAKSKERKVDQCNIRVRFPDRVCIDVNFAPDESIRLVYEAVTRCLADTTTAFQLYHSHPYTKIEKDDAKLVADLNFGTKTLLIFQTTHPGPYVREDLLQKAKTMSDVQKDTNDGLRQHPAGQEAESTASEQVVENPGKPSKGLRLGQKPKWLKLGKK